MNARFSAVLTFNPAALHLSAVIDLAASFLQPDTLHVSPFSIRPKQVTLKLLLSTVYYLLLKFFFIENIGSLINLFFFTKVSGAN